MPGCTGRLQPACSHGPVLHPIEYWSFGLKQIGVCILLLLALACGKGSPGGAASPPEDQQAAVRTLVLAEGSADDPVQVRLEYPALSLPGKSKVEDRVNAALFEAAEGYVREFREGLGEPVVEEPGAASTLDGTFETTLFDAGAASFRFTISHYLAGAAHPGATIPTFSFDLATGNQLALEDLFRPGSEHLKTLAAHCREAVEAVWLADGPLDRPANDWIEEGTRPVAANYASWNIGRSGLLITFQEYQVGPYAMGPVRCEVPTADIAGILDPDGPLPGGTEPARSPDTGPSPRTSPSPATPPPAGLETRSLGYPFSIQVGETVAMDGETLTITYDRLLEDSRCPADVQCVWEGNGRVLLTLADGESVPASIELNTSLEPKSVVYSGFTVTLGNLGQGEQPPATIIVARD